MKKNSTTKNKANFKAVRSDSNAIEENFMKPVEITLIIPSFNRADLITETIKSALDQTHPFREIIVVDDCSTDNTLEVLATFGNQITVIASDKVGVQVARNMGVAAARTEYITLCDSDDLLRCGYVETVGVWLSEHPECDTLYTNFQTFNEGQIDAEKFGKAPAGYFDDAERDGDFLTNIPGLYGKTILFQPLFPTGMTSKKTFYEVIGGFDSTFNGVGSEDWEYTLRAIERGNTAICNTPLALLRRHSSNDSRNTMRQAEGEITVLNHALKHHPLAKQYSSLILDDIDRRRLSIFELAFGSKQYGIAADTLSLIRNKPASLKFRIKQFILYAGSALRLKAESR